MKGNNKLIKIIILIARTLFGITFIFSGFVKAVDPIGFTYKIEDYLISFHLTQLIPLALTFAVVLILLEFLVGVFTILGLFRKITTFLAILFMVVMTPMTLYIAIENPVKDCGCFGDALIISNWATFYKNIILLSFAIILFVYREKIRPFFSTKIKSYVLVYIFIFSLLFCLYNILYLPIVDFRPYKVGVNIPEQMGSHISKGDVYENIYIYEKEGVQQEFNEDNYPWEDSTWTFVDFESKLLQEGDKPLIDEFHIVAYDKDSSGAFNKTEDITIEVLSRSISLLVISLSLDDSNEKGMFQIAELSNFAADNNIDMHILTSSPEKVIEKWNEKLGSTNLNFALMDELTLKTIVRSNPGLLLLKEGTIQAKWSSRNLPNSSELNEMINQIQSGKDNAPHNNSSVRLFIICILFIMPLLGVKWFDRKTQTTN